MTVTDTRDMVLVHRVFRREFRLLPLMARDVADGDTQAAGQISRHAREMLDALHHHHQNEDELLWPRLVQRTPAGTTLAQRMQAQHNVIGEILRRVDAVLPAWQRAARARDGHALADDLAELHARLEEHLDEEEQRVLPIVGRTITATQHEYTVHPYQGVTNGNPAHRTSHHRLRYLERGVRALRRCPPAGRGPAAAHPAAGR